MDYVRDGKIQGQCSFKKDERAALYFTISDIVHLLNTLLSVISADFLFYQTNQFYIK